MRCSSLLALLPALASARKLALRGPVVTYEGHKVYRVMTPEGQAHVERRLAGLGVTFMEDHHPGTWIDVIVPPADIESFEAMDLETEVLHEDLARDIEAEAAHKPYLKRQAGAEEPAMPSISYFDSYHPYEEHIDFLEDLVAAFPNNAEMIIAGESYEGRDIQGIHVWGKSGNTTTQAIYWHGTTHAREWISAMTSEYQMYQMIAGYLAGDEDVVSILDTYEFYLIPFVNPDGFIYTQTTERLWRKNRQPRCNETCVGTDLNRNWPQNWALPGGSSDDPCSQTFRGLRESDTPEVTSLTKHVLATADAHPGGIKWFVDWHSYSQLVLLPYGHDCSARAHNHEYQMELGAGIVDTIAAVNGTQYVAGPNCETLYPITGGSADFVFDNANAEVSWLIELTPNSAGAGGFILPPERILPTVTEMWEGVRWVLKELTA